MAGGKSLQSYITLRGSLIVLNVLVLFSVALIWPKLTSQPVKMPTSSITTTQTNTDILPSETPTLLPTPTTITLGTVTPQTVSQDLPAEAGLAISQPLVISLPDSGFYHLFVFNPLSQPYARLTNDAWDDVQPALSPDASRLAYTSRRNGYWDIYILDFKTGEITRITDTLAYDGNPAWSPDGRWIAYETYANGNLDIAISPVDDPSAVPVFLTENQAPDTSPAWSPQGRRIAYVSNVNGSPDIWIADLDAETDRLTNLTATRHAAESHPVWSPNGEMIAFASLEDGYSQIAISSSTNYSDKRVTGYGAWPVWSADSSAIAVILEEPNQVYLASYSVIDGSLIFPPHALGSDVGGLTWAASNLPPLNLTVGEPLNSRQQENVQPLNGQAGRLSVVPLEGVLAPQPYLHENAVAAFGALRNSIAYESGWDFLANLENAYVPLTSPLPPGMGSDWLYTGRAVAFPSAALDAGLISLAREDAKGQTYWRVFLKTRFQDGSQGMPLSDSCWDLNARYSGDPVTYDQGGQPLLEIPPGYWLDLTSLASRFGWERVPALTNWRMLFAGSRFNELVYRQGLQWEQAMLELYPPEILLTPTQVIPATRTPTRVPTWYKTSTPTMTVEPTFTPTPRPTWTPSGSSNGFGG